MKLTLTAFLLGSTFFSAFSAPESQPLIRRFAFVIGENDGGPKKPRLKYATSDAQSVATVMEELGGVDPKDVILAMNPRRNILLDRISEMKTRIAQSRVPNVRTELFFYYSGHSDDEGLLLGEERLSYPDLRRRIGALLADLSIIVLDSCASGNLTRIKGGHKAQPFLSDALSKLKGYVALTSSSSDEVAQESDRIKGSYFTHYLVSGLRGAADLSLDNRITLNEAYQYAYNQTLARTEKTAAGAQHPSYTIQLTGSGELVMTDIRRVSAKVILEKNILGRVFIRDKSDKIVAEVDKISPKPMAIGLDAGEYSLILFKDRQIGKAQVKLAHNRFAEIKVADFSPIEAEVATTRGGASVSDIADEEELVNIPTEFSILPGVSTNVAASDRTANNFSLSLLYARPGRVSGAALSLLGGTTIHDSLKGAQISPFFNQVGTTATGAQISAGYNRATEVTGVQVAGYNRSQRVTGVQIGGFNRSDEEIVGVQIGGANVTQKMESGVQIGGFNQSHFPLIGAQVGGINILDQPVTGAQIGGLFNQSPFVTGFQAGAINDAQKIYGPQFGGFNRAREMRGVQIAFLNYAENISGAQIGGANVASDIGGVQLGAVNYGASEEGVTIGLINLPKRGQFRIGYSIDDIGLNHLAIKYGTRYSYSFLQYGMKPQSAGALQSKAVGLGGDIPWGRLSLNIEGLVSRMDKASFVNPEGIWFFHTRFMPRYRPMDWCSVFGGISINVRLSGRSTYDFSEAEPKQSPWVGYLGGMEFLI